MFLLAACAPEAFRVAASVACDPGEVRLASTGRAYHRLSDALADARGRDAVCVGEGTWNLAVEPLCDTPAPTDGRVLHLVGAGSSRTTLLGGGDACLRLELRPDDELLVQGLTLVDLPLHTGATRVLVRDVTTEGYAGDDVLLRADAADLDLQGVSLVGNQVDYGAGFDLEGDGTLEAFRVEGNRSSAGYVGQLSGALRWQGGTVRGNVRTVDDPGYDFLEAWGTVELDGVPFAGNTANGPLVTSHGSVTLTDVVFADNRSDWRGVVATDASLVVLGGEWRDNRGSPGALHVVGAGRAQLAGVDVRENGACLVSTDVACLLEGASSPVDLTCDVNGCR